MKITSELRNLLDAASYAASIDCHMTDKIRLQNAINAFEISEAIPCGHCQTVSCQRSFSEEGDPLCIVNVTGDLE